MNILNLLILVPVLTVISIMLVKDSSRAKLVAAIGMGTQLILSIFLVYSYLDLRASGNEEMMLFVSDHLWYEQWNIHYSIGVDGISVALILLTAIISFAGVFASWTVKEQSKEFFITLIVLATGVFGFFISLDLFTMFLYYEIAVIPMYLLIGIWGSGKKEYSAMKLTLILMGASALLLVGILGIYFNSSPDPEALTFNFIEIAQNDIPLKAQLFFFPLTFVGFGALGALFPLHTWSPDGHASAPTAVSMLHAGVLMKLGGYGALRIAVYLMPEAASEYAWFFIILATIGAVYGSFAALVQKDLKYLNAYSSVSHLGLILFAILMFNKVAFTGAVLQMISHGFITALFFALIGMIYGRTHTRNITEMGGLIKVIPILGVSYIIAGFASLGLPGLSAFVAEMTIFVGAFQHDDIFIRVCSILVISSIVVTAVYILRAAATMLLGPIKKEEFKDIKDAEWHEKVSVYLLVAMIVAMGMYPDWLASMIGDSLNGIVERFVSR